MTTKTTKAKDLLVCNLVFPPYVNELNIGGYKFVRLPNYQKRVCEMQQDITTVFEFEIAEHNGVNRPTAKVYLPIKEKPSVIKWTDDNPTALRDILLLLTLFTKREVYCPEMDKDEDGKQIIKRKHGDDTDFDPDTALLADPREFAQGGILKCSLPKDLVKSGLGYANVGFERGLQEIYTRINNEDWKKAYENGWFLLYARMAFRAQPLESRFIHCWTIWEHLFTILNQHWMSEESLKRIHSKEKVSFLLTRFAFVGAIDKASHQRIERLSGIRNQIVHHAHLPSDVKTEDVVLVLHLTEFLISKILGLIPSNIFNTLESLDAFLKHADKSSKPKLNQKQNQKGKKLERGQKRK